MPSALHHIIGLARATGWLTTTQIVARRLAKRGRSLRVRVKGLKGRLELCPTDSDPFVMSQIFGWKEYDPGHEIVRRLRALAVAWVSEGILPVIVDGGANVGYSSIFFAAMIPEATILAIEPDPETCQRLSRNCQGWLTIKPKRGALWEHENGINLKDGGHGSWSNYVDRDGTFTPSFTLSGLLEEEGNCRLLVLKLDVEGAERAIAAASAEAVRSSACIMIEPHDFLRPGLACMQPLFQAIANIPFDTLICGENLIFLSPELMEVELQHR